MPQYLVKILVAGPSPPGNTEEGDLVCVVPSACDWGKATTLPTWERLEITNVTANSQEEAEALIRDTYMVKWDTGFDVNIVSTRTRAATQRYEAIAVADLKGDLDQAARAEVRDKVLARHKGTLVTEDADSFTFDAEPGIPEDEIKETMKLVRFRRVKIERTQMAKVNSKRRGSKSAADAALADKLRRKR